MAEITTAKDALEALSAGSQRLSDVDATVLFDISDEQEGQWSLIIEDGQFSVQEGSTESPTVTIEITAEDLAALVEGDLNPTRAFMQGRLKVKGDMSVAMRLQNLFGQGG